MFWAAFGGYVWKPRPPSLSTLIQSSGPDVVLHSERQAHRHNDGGSKRKKKQNRTEHEGAGWGGKEERLRGKGKRRRRKHVDRGREGEQERVQEEDHMEKLVPQTPQTKDCSDFVPVSTQTGFEMCSES